MLDDGRNDVSKGLSRLNTASWFLTLPDRISQVWKLITVATILSFNTMIVM